MRTRAPTRPTVMHRRRRRMPPDGESRQARGHALRRWAWRRVVTHATVGLGAGFGAACTPVTTRPDFRPDPRALVIVLDARPERVTLELETLVPAESLALAHVNARDGYVETAWYDPTPRRSYRRQLEIADLSTAVNIRPSAPPPPPPHTPLTR